MNCEHCDNNFKVQSTKYLSGYKKSLHTIFSKKEVCEDLVNIIISFLVNERGHNIEYQIKYRDGYYGYRSYMVCSPCFQIGLTNYMKEHKYLPSMRYERYLAMNFDIGKIEDKDYEKESRKYVLHYLVNDYKVDYYRKKNPTQVDWGNGKTLLKIDWK